MIEEKDKMFILNNILQEVKPLKLREKIYWRIIEFVNSKLPEDSVVLSEEEYEEKEKQIKHLKYALKVHSERLDHFYNLNEDVYYYEEKQAEAVKQASKETAEKIIIDLIALAKEKQREHSVEGFNPNHMKASEAEWYLFEKHLQNVTAPQFGVEIKES